MIKCSIKHCDNDAILDRICAECYVAIDEGLPQRQRAEACGKCTVSFGSEAEEVTPDVGSDECYYGCTDRRVLENGLCFECDTVVFRFGNKFMLDFHSVYRKLPTPPNPIQ